MDTDRWVGARSTATALALMPLGWLVANHYLPWLSAWGEGTSLALLMLAALSGRGSGRLSLSWILFVGISLLVVSGQYLSGRLFFGGDALMVAFYLLAFLCAVALGGRLGQVDDAGKPLQILALGILIAASCSITIALLQWTGVHHLGIWMADLEPGGRPYANVGQPNHLCSICLLGLASVGMLRQMGRIGAAGFWLGSLWMLAGMAMTSSRTGWLQVAGLVLLILLAGPRSGLAVGRLSALLLGLSYAGLCLAWPAANRLLLLQSGRALDQVGLGGTRSLHWASFVDAIRAEPLWGYGWQQASVAQVRMADTHPFVGEHVEHAHNVLLELLVANGAVIGTVLVLLLVGWFVTRLWTVRHPLVLWLLVAVCGVGVHGLLEFPLEYAYFLMPLGVCIGMVDALQLRRPSFQVPAALLRASGAALAAMLAWISVEYLAAEQGYRTLRLESARIGVTGLTTPPPDLTLLTQLANFQKFAHTEARVGMSAEELDWMRRVSERYAFPPSMFRYALATGLNGQSERAGLTLKRICRMHPLQRCIEAREGWAAAQAQFPVLRPIERPSLP